MKLRILFMIIATVLCGCGGGKKNNVSPTPPSSALLAAPAQNTICLNGQVISDSQSSVTFQWGAASNTNNYDLVIKDLLTGSVTTYNTTQTQLAVTLERSTPYSWYVVSKSNAVTTTARSDTWKFYNSGPGVITYAPFPAELTSPAYAASISATSGTVDLTWTGSAVNNELLTYDVYFGNSTSPGLLKGGVTDMFVNNVTVIAGTTYYWKVISKNSANDSSDSGLFTFTTK